MRWLAPATADGSLPPADDRLFAPHALGGVWLVIGIVALVAGSAVLLWALRPRHRRIGVAEPPATVHDAYLHRIDALGQRHAGGGLDVRHLHHELARMLRCYAGDTGTSGADAMSPGALHAAGRRPTAAAVRAFEHPQFAESPDGDPARALHLARTVIADDPGPGSGRLPHRSCTDLAPPVAQDQYKNVDEMVVER